MWLFRHNQNPTERAAEPPCSIIRVKHFPHGDDYSCIIGVVCACGLTHRYKIHGRTNPTEPRV